MKKYIIYRKLTKKVEMISDGDSGFDKSIFDVKEMDLTKTKLNELYNSERTLLIKGKLEMTPRVDKQTKKKDLQTQLDNAKDLDEIKEIIKEII